MTCVLAIDTATDACSVALVSAAGEQCLERTLPKAHNRHLLAMIDEILAPAGLDQVTHLVCGVGPGSFTGLRISTATVQGLAWPRDLPVAGLCSLTAQVLQAASGLGATDGWVLSTIDAQIDQLYGRWFYRQAGEFEALDEPWIARPEDLPVPDTYEPGQPLSLLGSGAGYRARLPINDVQWVMAEAHPSALPMAKLAYDQPHGLCWRVASELAPSYVQQDVGWKKLAEQGPR